MIQPAFNYSNIIDMIPIFKDKTLAMMAKWTQEKEEFVDVSAEMSNVTLACRLITCED